MKLRYLGDSEASVPKGAVCAPVGGQRAIRLCMTRTKAEPGPALTVPSAVCKQLKNMGNADRESFVALLLNAQNRVIGVEEIAKGTVNGVETHPREVFKGAILSNAVSMIVAHNHPSGNPTPSQADRDLTNRLVDAGRLLGIPVLDHIIVTDNRCSSMRDAQPGMFGGAKKSGNKLKKRR